MIADGLLPILETTRLWLRPVAAADLALLIELNSDPAVMTYTRGRAATPDETIAEWRQRLDRQSNAARGLGYWLGFEDDTFVGWWSASFFAPRPEISGVGYRLRRDGWGRGLATEGACAMIGQAFADPGIETVFASTMAVNVGSRRVLEKLGLKHTSTELETVGYELARTAWVA